ncbi:MAG: DEAD/DEAH box helicase [Planctomycetes bacterium]|nr:DEAD/DEAH box helicase [Planctomycetota bacterium]
MPLSHFLPTVRDWFSERIGTPSAPQERGWPVIASGAHTLIAAPTGSGKTLAAFLHAIDSLLRLGQDIPDETRVLYVSPLRALGNDIRDNLEVPLREITERNFFLPELRVQVRSSDTSPSERQKMRRKSPHILVTTPESLYILLTTPSGRAMLETVRTVIIDEIHALVRDKRGSHLALSLERLETLTGGFQRIGLSATQKPLSDVGNFLGGVVHDESGTRTRDVQLIDAGHRRELDLAIEVPGTPLSTVCSNETWDEIYARIVELVEAHTTTLIFVNTRKMSERVAARLSDLLGDDVVASHHGSLSKDVRLEAERKLKNGELRALVATASLELGIDVGDIDLVIQIAPTASIATFLQRVGRAGHSLGKTPKGRLFPLTIDELVWAAATVSCVRRGDLDRTPQPPEPLDILAQQIVAACVTEDWQLDELFDVLRRSWPYRNLTREDFDATIELHTKGRNCLLHRDTVLGKLRATKRARLTAVMSGGAIPDLGQYRVILEPDGTLIGTLDEDFSIDSSVGDIFQLGNASWRILRIERGVLRVADARGAPPTIPFWFGEAPARTIELSAEIAALREELVDAEWCAERCGISLAAADQIADFVLEGRRALGTVPTQQRIIAERFFDESGGQQLVIHAPFGGRILRAWGLALRKRFCKGFGFELQAAAGEDSFLISLGPMHSFKLDEVFAFLKSATARDVLIQACLGSPMFESRWRWNTTRSLLVERMRNGTRVPTPLQRFRADDLLAEAFPQVAACPETLPGGDLPVPMEHPLVRQTILDCLHEAMDVDGMLDILRGLETGAIETVAVDLSEPSPFARGILAAQPYAFLDDAPLEERRTQAVITRRSLEPRLADEIGALDPDAVARVRGEAWPAPSSAEELHEALQWMGYVSRDEAVRSEWTGYLAILEGAGRIEWDGDRCFAVGAPRDDKTVWRGRLEALGPCFSDDHALLVLESEGIAMRCRLEGREAWCDRRLLARIHRYTVDRLRAEIAPVTASEFLRFLARWQHVEDTCRLHGPNGVREVLTQLQGFEAPAAAWEGKILPMRVRGYRREWLDEATLSGAFVWGRFWSAGNGPIKTTPLAFVPREELDAWTSLAGPSAIDDGSSHATKVLELLSSRGAVFPQELERIAGLASGDLESALAELIARGLVTCDSWGGLRSLIVPPSRRKYAMSTIGRWSPLRAAHEGEADETDLRTRAEPHAEHLVRILLARWGVVFRRVLQRERLPIPWREMLRVLRRLELRGDVRGGRFVAGFDGEQFALPGVIRELRQVRRDHGQSEFEVGAADPLNLAGILTPDARVSRARRGVVSMLG